MNKLLSILINSGLQVKEVQENPEGTMFVFRENGKNYRVFCAEQKPVPKKIVKSVLAYL